MAEYKPLFVYLEPASIPQVVAHIQKYLAENPIISDEETIAELIREYIAAHPEIIAVASVNGKVGAVVLTGSDIMINPSSAVSVETQLLNLASMINNTGADVTQIQANISQIYTTIGTLQTDVETNASNISALQTSVEGHGTRLAAAETDIDNLETAQTAQGTRLNAAEGNISSLQTRMTQAEMDIDNNETNIGTLQTGLASVSSDVQSLKNLEGWETSTNYIKLPNGLKMIWGNTQAINCNANSVTPLIIQFGITFSRAPMVQAINYTSSAAVKGSPALSINNVSSTQFEIREYNSDTDGRSPSVWWLAVGY